MTTFTNDYSKDFERSLRYLTSASRKYGKVTFHYGDASSTAKDRQGDGVVQCFKLALVLASKFWRDLLEYTGNENVDIIVCEYSKEFIENYVTLCERGEVTYSQKVKDEDFETFVENTKRGKELKDEFEIEDNVTCQHCLKVFSNPRTCRRHINTFHGKDKNTKYNCDLCPKKFKTSNGLKSHITNDHENKEPFQCITCNNVYQNKNELRRHCKLEQHTYHKRTDKIDEDQMCKVCYKKVGLGNMQTHLEKYHSEKSRTWICNRCGQSFKRKDNLQRHERYVHHLHEKELTAVDKLYDDSNRTYKCPECQKTFDTKRDAKNHIVQSQCNLECEICGKHFSLAQHLKRHKKIHDKKNKLNNN